jgi:6-phosphogluconolactonase
MANAMNIKYFSSRELLTNALTRLIVTSVERNVLEKNQCTLLLSGGTTPKPIYEKLSTQIACPENLLIGLVDERFVAVSSEFSNERMIRNAMGSEFNIIGMIQDTTDSERNLSLLRKSYEPFIRNTDIVLLGMGTDGHTASIFPGDDSSEKIRKSAATDILNTTAPTHPKQRITCSTKMILLSKEIILLITGVEKKNVLLNFGLNLPIHDILKNRPDTLIFYAD